MFIMDVPARSQDINPRNTCRTPGVDGAPPCWRFLRRYRLSSRSSPCCSGKSRRRHDVAPAKSCWSGGEEFHGPGCIHLDCHWGAAVWNSGLGRLTVQSFSGDRLGRFRLRTKIKCCTTIGDKFGFLDWSTNRIVAGSRLWAAACALGDQLVLDEGWSMAAPARGLVGSFMRCAQSGYRYHYDCHDLRIGGAADLWLSWR